jgi:hypothetical protein
MPVASPEVFPINSASIKEASHFTETEEGNYIKYYLHQR